MGAFLLPISDPTYCLPYLGQCCYWILGLEGRQRVSPEVLVYAMRWMPEKGGTLLGIEYVMRQAKIGDSVG